MDQPDAVVPCSTELALFVSCMKRAMCRTRRRDTTHLQISRYHDFITLQPTKLTQATMPEPEPQFHYWRSLLWSQWCFTPPYPTTSWVGKTVIVTGSNVGLGREAARHFARLGAEKVILAARNLEAAEKAKGSIEATTKCGADVVECWALDLCSYDSVKEFAARCKTLSRLDCLLENAGVSKYRFRMVPGALDELQITTNVVSTFLLAFLLLPKLKETALKFNTLPHLTIVTSELHHQTTIPERKAVKSGKHATLLEALNDPRPRAVLLDIRFPNSWKCSCCANGPRVSQGRASPWSSTASIRDSAIHS